MWSGQSHQTCTCHVYPDQTFTNKLLGLRPDAEKHTFTNKVSQICEARVGDAKQTSSLASISHSETQPALEKLISPSLTRRAEHTNQLWVKGSADLQPPTAARTKQRQQVSSSNWRDFLPTLSSDQRKTLITICYYRSQLQLHHIRILPFPERLLYPVLEINHGPVITVENARMIKSSKMSVLCIAGAEDGY